MRYDRRVTLVKGGEEVYDWETGDYVLSEPTETELWANVSDAGLERREVLFGSVKERGLVVRFRNRLPAYDYLLINGERYSVTTEKRFRHKTVLFVGESDE